ncbi:MAG TPA: zinc ribbon domain-containing protein [Pyrinomonadaceae bacterium]|nr:zinc ribbon domain-containing protein [Pyrinomonadaceae bacterium]
MFCPQCGANQSEELKFCNLCGANLQAVREAVVATRAPGEKFDWSKTWVADMFLSEEERKRRAHQLEHEQGVTPEVKRYNEIKAGVITSCVGLGAAIFLFFFMQGIILSGQNPPGDNEILSRIWIAGVIPFLIGLGIMFNGIFLSRKIVEVVRREALSGAEPGTLGGQTVDPRPRSLHSADTTEFISPDFSVTEDPTKHLAGARRKE